jgi:hypothetical protein
VRCVLDRSLSRSSLQQYVMLHFETWRQEPTGLTAFRRPLSELICASLAERSALARPARPGRAIASRGSSSCPPPSLCRAGLPPQQPAPPRLMPSHARDAREQLRPQPVRFPAVRVCFDGQAAGVPREAADPVGVRTEVEVPDRCADLACVDRRGWPRTSTKRSRCAAGARPGTRLGARPSTGQRSRSPGPDPGPGASP